MATRKVKHDGKDYVIEAEQRPNGKFITRIDPAGGTGRYIRGADIQITDPSTGKTTTKPGPPTEFDSEKGALDAGEDNVKLGMI
ncbi:MAG: hypothetical protein U1E05_08160 [Patescibacteria group bacterium]|nr:hypothetical protein [Patescibacteria group bacterium]